MKIGIITPSNLPVPAVYGGAIETLINRFIDENEKHVVHDLFVFSEYDRNAELISLNYKKSNFVWFNKSIAFKLLDIFFRVFKKIKLIKISYRVYIILHYIKTRDLDAVIIEGVPFYASILKKYCKNKCKIIFHIHAMLYENDIHLVPALALSDKVIVVSEFIKTDLIKRINADSSKIKIVYNCVSNIFFDHKENESKENGYLLKHKLSIGSDDFVLIFTGRLVADKGLLELVKACKIASKSIKLKLLIIGSFGSNFGKVGRYDNSFENIVNKEIVGFENYFLHLGFIQNNKLANYYSIANLAVVPSLCDEAAGLVAIEAMAAGLPLIYSSKGGIKEYVAPNCGLMIDMDAENCIETLASSIIKIYNCNELQKNMSLASYEQAKKFTELNYYTSLLSVIN